MATLTPVDFDPFSAAPPPGDTADAHPLTIHGGKKAAPTLTPVDYDPFAAAPPTWGQTAADVLQSAGTGIEKGAIGLATLPATVEHLAHKAFDPVFDLANNAIMGPRPAGMPANSDLYNVLGPQAVEQHIADDPWIGKFYEPQTRAGRYAETIGEFASGGASGKAGGVLKTLGNFAKHAVAPAITSETAGELTQGTAAEPWARFLASLLPGGVTRLATGGTRAAEKTLATAAGDLDRPTLQAAQDLMNAAAQQGTPITLAEAVQQVTNSGTRLGSLQRVVEQSRGGADPMAKFYADRPGQVQQAGNAAIDQIGTVPVVPLNGSMGPIPPSPSIVAPAVQQAAQGFIDATPQAVAARQAFADAGPRVTPEQAGQVIQPDLRGVYDQRLEARSAQARQDYRAAGADTIPPAGINAIIGQLGRQAAADDTGLLSPRLNDIRGRLIDTPAQPATPPGPAVRTPVLGPNGQVIRYDTTPGTPGTPATPAVPITDIENLNRVRKTYRDRIELPATAPKAIDKETAARIGPVLEQLDATMAAGSPAYRQANTNFQQNSIPLQPFENTPAIATAIKRDPFDTRFLTPADRVPDMIAKGGPDAARNFNSVATGPARQALESHLTTQLLDQASGADGVIDADRLARMAQNNVDTLRQFPVVQARIQRVIDTQRATEPLRNTLVGRLATTPGFREQASIILDPNPIPGSAHEVGEAVRQVAARAPEAARALVSQRIRQVFSEATQNNMAGPNQAGGAKFNAIIRGNDQQARNLKAAVEALHGPGVWRDFQKTLDVFEAMGRRQAPGSQTEFNKQITAELSKGGKAGEVTAFAASPGRWWTKAHAIYEDWRYGRNTEILADLLTRPDAATRLGQIANAAPNSVKSQSLAALYLLGAAANQTRDRVAK